MSDDDKILTDPIVLMCAFRYALGRATYIVGWIADELIRHRDALRPQWRQQTVRDIREAVGGKRAGMDMDERRWLDVVDAFHAAPTACRGCALTEATCRSFPPLCCDRCDHGPGAPLSPDTCTPGHCDRCMPGPGGEHIDVRQMNQAPCEHVGRDA